mmetsp:Transcript_21399/g.54511  ORF Transcript_21399/g.54511 Transcript_21399/m.54511 type:complete len:234 (+) Transcript_21399:3713-4414(+)
MRVHSAPILAWPRRSSRPASARRLAPSAPTPSSGRGRRLRACARCVSIHHASNSSRPTLPPPSVSTLWKMRRASSPPKPAQPSAAMNSSSSSSPVPSASYSAKMSRISASVDASSCTSGCACSTYCSADSSPAATAAALYSARQRGSPLQRRYERAARSSPSLSPVCMRLSPAARFTSATMALLSSGRAASVRVMSSVRVHASCSFRMAARPMWPGTVTCRRDAAHAQSGMVE